MKRSKCGEEQISYALRQSESDTPVQDVCRQLGIAEATFYMWWTTISVDRTVRWTI